MSEVMGGCCCWVSSSRSGNNNNSKMFSMFSMDYIGWEKKEFLIMMG
jgi:hypothetical protein